MNPGSRGEIALISLIEKHLGPSASAAEVPFGDDMAAIPGAAELIWTTDMLMDGTDFDSRSHSWHAIGRKAMAVNLSDCAAMAAQPVAALCAVALNNRMSLEDGAMLVGAADAFGRSHGCPVIGGDTNSWDSPTVIAITVIARLPGAPILRSGGRPGDSVFLTGPVGGSLLGRHITFEPRVREALAIRAQLHPRALIDISDGLSLDLWRICEASRCGALIDEAALHAAIHPDAALRSRETGRTPLDHALSDGEDFELIVALDPAADEARCRAVGLRRIGILTPERELRMRHDDGRTTPIEPRGWEHFR